MARRRKTHFPFTAMFLSCLLISCIIYQNQDVPHQPENHFNAQAQEPLLRVLIRKASNKEDLKMKILGSYVILNDYGDEIYRDENLPACLVQQGTNSFQFGNLFQVEQASLRIVPLHDALIELEGTFYRGEVILSQQGGKIQTVLEIPMETYLLGVVGSEMSNSWSPNCLAAQAIVARTYAFRRYQGRKTKNYHMDDTVSSQVFKGLDTENENVFDAVKETQGQVLTYAGKMFTTYYHSTCGGHTTNAKGLLEHKDVFPLSGVPCQHCTASKYYTWTNHISYDEASYVIETLTKGGTSPILSITPHKTDRSGRCQEIRVLFQNSPPKTYKSADFRRVLGYSKLRSLKFKISFENDEFIFEGGGFGHGVGLCQMGAKGMADLNFPYKDILSHYYPGSTLEKKW